jgi:hypothetical protein
MRVTQPETPAINFHALAQHPEFQALVAQMAGAALAGKPLLPAANTDPEEAKSTPENDPLHHWRGVARERLGKLKARAKGFTRFTEDDLTVGQLWEKRFPKMEWQVRHFSLPGRLMVLSAEPKCGKTWTMLDLLMAIACRACLWGCADFPVETSGPTYVFCAEDTQQELQARTTALAVRFTQEQRALVAKRVRILPSQSADLLDDESVVEFCARVLRHSNEVGELPAAVLIDPLLDVFSIEDENSATELKRVMGQLKFIRDITGATVWVVQHAGKASASSGKRRGGQRMRGSSVIHQMVQGGVYFEKTRPDDDDSMEARVTFDLRTGRKHRPIIINPVIVDNEDGFAMRLDWEVRDAPPKEEASPKKKDTRDERRARALSILNNADRPMGSTTLGGMLRCTPATAKALLLELLREGLVAELTTDNRPLGWAIRDGAVYARHIQGAAAKEPT